MFRNVLIATAIVIASPALAGAQDIFWSFSPTELVAELNFVSPDPCDPLPVGEDPFGASGSVYIFSDGLFGFELIDLDFSIGGDSSTIRVTGGEAFNPAFTSIGDTRFFSSEISFETPSRGENNGRLFAAAFPALNFDQVVNFSDIPPFIHRLLR